MGGRSFELRIKRIETFASEYVGFVRITADDGATGIGQVSTYNSDITSTVLHRQVAPWVLGVEFDDIDALGAGCHFTDCRHRDEPRCAVKAALAEGRLVPGRLESYLKLQDELAWLARQQDERAQLDEKRRSKIIGKALKQHLKTKRG